MSGGESEEPSDTHVATQSTYHCRCLMCSDIYVTKAFLRKYIHVARNLKVCTCLCVSVCVSVCVRGCATYIVTPVNAPCHDLDPPSPSPQPTLTRQACDLISTEYAKLRAQDTMGTDKAKVGY